MKKRLIILFFVLAIFTVIGLGVYNYINRDNISEKKSIKTDIKNVTIITDYMLKTTLNDGGSYDSIYYDFEFLDGELKVNIKEDNFYARGGPNRTRKS